MHEPPGLPPLPPDAKALLRPREYECWRYALLGMSIRETAKQMTVSEKTVEAYRNAILCKLNVDGADFNRVRQFAVTILVKENRQLRERLRVLGVLADAVVT